MVLQLPSEVRSDQGYRYRWFWAYRQRVFEECNAVQTNTDSDYRYINLARELNSLQAETNTIALEWVQSITHEEPEGSPDAQRALDEKIVQLETKVVEFNTFQVE